MFDNLLPDCDAIRKRVGADGTDAFSLLTALGRDCVAPCNSCPTALIPALPATPTASRSATRRSRTSSRTSLIDFLNAVPEARDELALYEEKAISIITWMEVMIGATQDVEAPTGSFLDTFDIISIQRDVAERAVVLRRDHRIRLPDAVIWAPADVHSMLLVTRNTKDFAKETPGIRVPYAL